MERAPDITIPLPHPKVRFEIARSKADIEAALRLVHDAYVRMGLMTPRASGLRASIHSALRDTVTFVAKVDDVVVSTMSLVPDTQLGLPMDAIYKPEVDQLRKNGRRMAEMSMLCDRRIITRETFRERILSVFVGQAKLTLHYAMRKAGLTDLVAAVHPHHAGFYRRYLLFEKFAGERRYASVEDHPAVALRLDVETIQERGRELPAQYEAFFGSPPSDDALVHTPLARADVMDLFASKTDVLRDAHPDVRQFVLSQYGFTE